MNKLGALIRRFNRNIPLSLTVAALALFFAASVPAQLRAADGDAASAEKSTLTILTYNTLNGKGLDGKRDYARTAKVISAQTPDVVALQELDRKTKRSNGADVLGELASATKMNGEYGPAIDFQGGQYGIGMLTAEKPLKTEYIPLPGTEERRCLLIAEFDRFVFCCSHWSLTEADRDETAKIVTEKMKSFGKPAILCGDFNAGPNDVAIRTLSENWTILSPDAPTFPANAPKIRIDYICAADPTGKIAPDAWRAAVRSAEVVDEPVASDHRPVRVVLDLNVFDAK